MTRFPLLKDRRCDVFFLLTKIATEMEIIDDQYSDRQILSVMLSVKCFPTNCVSYTDGINPLVKLFIGVVILKYIFIHNSSLFRLLLYFHD